MKGVNFYHFNGVLTKTQDFKMPKPLRPKGHKKSEIVKDGQPVSNQLYYESG